MIIINKGTRSTVRMAIYNNYTIRTPINLSQFLDIICVVLDNGRLLIEKKLSTNQVFTEKFDTYDYDSIIRIVFESKDTIDLNISPSSEERIREFQVVGIDRKTGQPVLIYKDQFYLEGSGYYVKSVL